MSLCGSDQDKERLVARLRRIEGQVRGLAGMVEQDRECIDVLHQIASVSAALRGVWTQMVGDHIRGCIASATMDRKTTDELITELVDHLGKLR